MTDQHTVDRLTAALDANADRVPVVAEPLETAPSEPALVVPLVPAAARRPARRRARLAATVAVAAVAAAFAVGVPVALHQDHVPAPTSAAGSAPHAKPSASTPKPAAPVALGAQQGRAALDAAAGRRAATGDLTAPAGSFVYAETVSGPESVVGTDNRQLPNPAGAYTLDQSWAPADPTAVWTRYKSNIKPPVALDPLSFAGTCDNLYSETQDAPPDIDCASGGRTALLPSYLQTPAASPQVLLDRLRAFEAQDVNPDKVHDVDALVLTEIGSQLAGLTVPADLQAQLIRVLALLPSAKVLTSVPTWTGRTGVAVQITHVNGSDASAAPFTDGIVLDPDTGRLIGQYQGTPGGKDYAPTDVAFAVVGSVVKGQEQLPHS